MSDIVIKTEHKKLISLIVPVYNEERNIIPMYKTCKAIMNENTQYNFELIFVNDGSKDASFAYVTKLALEDERIVGIDFSRNFGKELALTAGVQHCKGDAAIFMDADLQHPPALIPDFIKKWENGAEIVASIRKATKKKSFIKDIGSKVFYSIMNKNSDSPLTQNATDFKLIDKKVITILQKFTEHNRMFRGLIDWVGFKTEYVEFIAPERLHGEATYSLVKLVRLALNSMTSFSLFPLRLTGYLGMFLTFGSFILLCVMSIFKFIVKSNMFSSIAFVIVLNTLILGIILACLGLIALYIGQIRDEVVNRPLYVIREKIQKEEKNNERSSILNEYSNKKY